MIIATIAMLIAISSSTMQIFIDHGDGLSPQQIEVNAGDTVQDIISLINLDPNEFKLSHSGKILDDPSLPLSDAGICAEAVINVIRQQLITLSATFKMKQPGCKPVQILIKNLTINENSLIQDVKKEFTKLEISDTPLIKISFIRDAKSHDILPVKTEPQNIVLPKDYSVKVRKLPFDDNAELMRYYHSIRSFQNRDQIPIFLREESQGGWMDLIELGGQYDVFIVQDDDDEFADFGMNDIWQSIGLLSGGAHSINYAVFPGTRDEYNAVMTELGGPWIGCYLEIPWEYDVRVEKDQIA